MGVRTATSTALAWMLLGSGLAACGDAAPQPDAAAQAEAAPQPDAAAQAEAAPQPDAAARADAAPQPDAAARAEAPPGDATGVPPGAAAASPGALVQDGTPESTHHPDPGSYWLLTEFDWGDDREVVYESTRFDPFYACHRKSHGICALTQVDVNGEELLAQFHFNAQDRLFQVVFLTPDLDRQQADRHLARVWRELADYVTRHKGEPESEAGLPDLDSLEFGPPKQTHLWRAPGLDVRLMVGRRDTDLFYVGAFFSDPRQPEAREKQLAEIAASDQALREKRAKAAASPSASPAGPASGAQPAAS
jgi:hypothetical protein